MSTTPTSLHYFDNTQPVTIQVDAPQRGIGAVLLQANGQWSSQSSCCSKLRVGTPISREKYQLSCLVWRSFIIMPMADPLWWSLTPNLLRPSFKSTCQEHHLALREYCCPYRSMMCKLNTFLGRKYLSLMLFQGSAPAFVKLYKG